MKNLYFLRSMFLSALAAMAITACSDSDEGGNDGEGPGGGETPAPTSSLTVNEKAEAQTFTYDMKAAKEALAIDASGDWTLTCDDEEAPTWCTPDITEGKSGKSTLTFDVKVPLLPAKANYTLALKDDAEVNVKVTVEQEPMGPWAGISKQAIEFPALGGTEMVTVHTRNVDLAANEVFVMARAPKESPNMGKQFQIGDETGKIGVPPFEIAITKEEQKITFIAAPYSSDAPTCEVYISAWSPSGDELFSGTNDGLLIMTINQLAE